MIITQSEQGGLRRYITDVIDGLNKDKYDVALVCNTDMADSSFITWLNSSQSAKEIKLYDIKSFVREVNLKNDIISFSAVVTAIKKFHPDIVHTQSSKAGAIGRIAAKIMGIKKIYYTPHAYSFLSKEFSSRKKKVFVEIEKFLSRHCTTKTFNVSQSEKDSAISNHIDVDEKFIVIPNGIPNLSENYRQYARKEMNVDPNQKVIGNVARFSKQKNPELFVNIASQLIKSSDHSINLKFVWIGSGELQDKIEEMVSKQHLKSFFIFLGDRNDAEYLMEGFDVYLATSIFEGFSYSLLEAARAKLPVIAPDVPGIIDFSKIYPASYLYKLNDPIITICGLISSVLTNMDLQTSTNTNIKFTYSDMINAITTEYDL